MRKLANDFRGGVAGGELLVNEQSFEQLIAARKLQPASKGLNLELARLYTAQLDFQRAHEILLSIPRESLEPAQRRVAARLLGQQGDIERAIGFAEGAQTDAPPLDRLYLAELYRRFGQDTKAEAIYKSLLEKPDRLEIVMAAADYYASRGKSGLAMQTLANLEKLVSALVPNTTGALPGR